MEETLEHNVEKEPRSVGFGAAWITVISLILAAALGAYIWVQLSDYSENVVEIFAEQQDAYVQLVLDQINLVDDRSDEEIIRDILGTIDGTSNEYWTLSQNDSLVFVKDVAESNRYRGFSTQTYFDTSSAMRFIDELKPDQVRHSIIMMDERAFIASGVAFEYNNAVYRMCLLTSEHMVVDSNAYLAARVNIGIAVGICLLVMVLMALFVGLRGDRWKRWARELEDEDVDLRHMVERLNTHISKIEPVDTRATIYDEAAAELLFGKLLDRDELPSTLISLAFKGEEEENAFLSESVNTLGKRVVKFRLGKELVLVFIGLGALEAQTMLATMIKTPVVVRSIYEIQDIDTASWEQARRVLLKEGAKHHDEEERS